MEPPEAGAAPPRRQRGEDGEESPDTLFGRWLGQFSRPVVLFPVVGFLALGLLWGVTMNLIEIEHESARDAARASARENLETYEAQVVRVLREIDQTLKSYRYAYENRGDAEAALSDLRERDLLPPELVYTVRVRNTDGDVEASTAVAPSDSAGGGRFFQRILRTDSLVVARPAATPDSGAGRLRFGRRLITPDGSVGGVAVVEVDASFFVSGYESSRLGQRGVLAVLGTDGVFRVRRTGQRVSAGTRVAYDSLVPADQTVGETRVVLATSPWDGVRRYTSARQLYDFPLAVVVGLSEEEELAVAERRADTYLERAAAGSVALVLFLGILGRLSWKLESVQERERQARLAHARRVEHLAYHDSLTGLPNRSLLSRLLERSISRARRYDRQVAVLFLDLDGFKRINDTLGHEAGDQLLTDVADRLEATLRDSDTVARVGGDEFVVLLPEVDESAHARTVGRKLLETLREPFEILGQEFTVTTSVGVSLYPGHGGDEEELLKNADVAMYQAKEAGKNSLRVYSSEMSRSSRERLELENSLRHALANDEFELHYQPRRETTTSRITGMEALLRWRHPDLGLVEPMRFLPLAEEMGLIVPIGRWVLQTACAQNVEWQETGMPRLSMAVNLSAGQFFDEDLIDIIASALEESGMDPELLELEICESVLTRDPERTLPILENLKEMGVKLTIDNFGTGYSSLAVLRRFPLDTIKVDRSFIRDSGENRVNREVTDAIVAMGRTLSSSLVAQGVETAEQADYIRENACDQVQGFYYNRPMPPEDFTELLRSAEASRPPDS